MYCEKLFEALDNRLNDKKSIDQIAEELCPTISKPRDKIIGLIKSYKGGQYLIQNHDWLGYHAEMIRNPVGMHPKEKIENRNEIKKEIDLELFKVIPGIEGAEDKLERIDAQKRLKKKYLYTKPPSLEQYNIWINHLDDVSNYLGTIFDEMSTTTDARYLWRIKNLIKKTKELKGILLGQKMAQMDITGDEGENHDRQ